MAFEEILEPFERLIADVFEPAAIRAIERGGDWRAAWSKISESGFLDALVSENSGGFGLSWDAASELFQALGRNAVPLPVGETMVLRYLLAESGSDCPEGPLKIAASGNSLQARLQDDYEATEVAVDPDKAETLLAFMYTAQIAGAAGHLLEMTVGYANERVQFGKPVGRQQAVQQQLAVMAQEAVAMRLAVEVAVEGGSPPDNNRAGAAKAIASRYAPSICSVAHGVHGAIGISAEYDLQLFTRRIQDWRLAGGSESGWEARIGRALLSSSDTMLDWVRGNLHH